MTFIKPIKSKTELGHFLISSILPFRWIYWLNVIKMSILWELRYFPIVKMMKQKVATCWNVQYEGYWTIEVNQVLKNSQNSYIGVNNGRKRIKTIIFNKAEKLRSQISAELILYPPVFLQKDKHWYYHCLAL